jgi:hypothetical protein
MNENRGTGVRPFPPKVLERIGAPGKTVHSTVTPDDSASESGAKFAAEQLIRKLKAAND